MTRGILRVATGQFAVSASINGKPVRDALSRDRKSL